MAIRLDNLIKKNWFKYMLIFLWVLIVVTFASKCSFIFRMNDWYDSNCYFTVANSMKNGNFTLYRDIYEQKGPYLYFIHIIAITLVPNSYVGMYFIEVVFGLIFAIFTYKILGLYIESDKRKMIWLILFVTAYYMSPSFASGDSVEELTVPLEMGALYFLLKAYKTNTHIKWYEVSIIGFFTGFVFLCKYVDIGFFAGIMIMVVIFDLKDKKIKDALLQLPYFLIGFVVAWIPCILYFVSTNAINDFYTVYFYNNIFIYSAHGGSVLKKIFYPFIGYFAGVGGCYPIYVLIVTTLVYVFRNKMLKSRLFIHMLVTYLLMAFLTYAGGAIYIYYGLIFVCFGIFGIIVLDRYSYEWKILENIKRMNYKFLGILLPLCFLAVFIVNEDGWFAFRTRDTYPQLNMVDIINDYNDKHEEKATILNYGWLDIGIYYNTNTMPSTKYFCWLNISLKELDETHSRILSNGEVTFVCMMDEKMPEEGIDNYTLVYEGYSWFEFTIHNYYLYQLNTTI